MHDRTAGRALLRQVFMPPTEPDASKQASQPLARSASAGSAALNAASAPSLTATDSGNASISLIATDAAPFRRATAAMRQPTGPAPLTNTRLPSRFPARAQRAGRWRGWLGEDSESGAWIPPKAGEGGASVCGIWRMVSGRTVSGLIGISDGNEKDFI